MMNSCAQEKVHRKEYFYKNEITCKLRITKQIKIDKVEILSVSNKVQTQRKWITCISYYVILFELERA